MTTGGTTRVHVSDGGTATTRTAWVDALKGVVVAEVVLHHVRTALEDSGARLPGVAPFDDIAGPVRMPLMFLLSGLFAAGPVAGMARRLWRDKVGNLAYLVALWSVIAVAVGAAAAAVLGRPAGEAVERFGSRLLDGVQPLWFLVALAVFFAYARLVRHLSVMVQLAGSVIIAAVALLGPPPGLVERMWHLPFFLLGLHFPAAIGALAARLRVNRFGRGVLGRPWVWIGARTLPVFLVHAVTLPLGVRAAESLGVVGALVATVALVATSLAVFVLLKRATPLWGLPSSTGRSARTA